MTTSDTSAGDEAKIKPSTYMAREDVVPYVDLSAYNNRDYHPGRGLIVRVLWYVISLIVFEGGWFPVSGLKRWILRLFGARIGKGVVIKPHVTIKYPWRLTISDHSWIGQQAWIDNLAQVDIGSHVCISQRVYLCTGSHDHRSATFDLQTAPIVVGNGVWLAAGCIVLPGVRVGANAVVCAGTTIRKNVPDGMLTWGAGSHPRALSAPVGIRAGSPNEAGLNPGSPSVAGQQ